MRRGRLAILTQAGGAWARRRGEALREPGAQFLVAILAVGLLLRVLLTIQWRPAFVGFPDSGSYVFAAHAGVFADPLRPAGYVVFLRLMHAIAAHVTPVIAVQHALGVTGGLLLYSAMRRAGVRRGVALVPAAVVLLGGAEVFLEHALLSESLFVFLVCVALYAIVRSWRGRRAWALAAGLALGASIPVRTVGIALALALIAGCALSCPGGVRSRALNTVVLVIGTLTVALAFMGWHRSATGSLATTDLGYLDLYAHVASFADCSEFTVPAGDRGLCIHVPVHRRQGHDVWEFTTQSPALHAFPVPRYGVTPPRNENSSLLAFSLAAIRGQPGAYLTLVGRELVRLYDPDFPDEPYVPAGNLNGYGNTPSSLSSYLMSNQPGMATLLGAYYPGYREQHGDIAALGAWERVTRVDGPLMAILALLALLAPILARGEARRAASLLMIAALALLVAPILGSEYDARFVIPGLGPLGAAAALGGEALVARLWALRPLRG